MLTQRLKNLNLVKPCWICLTFSPHQHSEQLKTALMSLGMAPMGQQSLCYTICPDGSWGKIWPAISAELARLKATAGTKVSVIAGETRPTAEDAACQHRSVEETDTLSLHMWLPEAIEENRLLCRFQPVMDRRGEVFGYESLVRGVGENGGIITGGDIFRAGKALRIEHLIDRHLHELAVRTFTEEKRSGFLFINLVPGFIQRPEFYFEGLREAAARCYLNARQIVMDCTNSESSKDIRQLQAIVKYCQSQGYLVSLDDIESVQTAAQMLKTLEPEFIKLDMRLVHRVLEDESAKATIHQLVELTRNTRCMLIAEGVETQAQYDVLANAGVGLFQGYLFSPPEV